MDGRLTRSHRRAVSGGNASSPSPLTGYSATVTSSIEERAVESRINLVGIGLYTPAEAGRLIQVRPAKLARWLRGHSIKGKALRAALAGTSRPW
jgi:hypothetical protein